MRARTPRAATAESGLMRPLFIPSLLAVGNPTDDQIAMLSTGSFALSFIIQACVAELWIRVTRTKTMSPIRVQPGQPARPAEPVS